MPVHDWTRVDAGLFHSFHQRWISALCYALNTGGLPPDYLALAEQSIRGPIPDVLTLRLAPATGPPDGTGPAVAVADAPPRVGLVRVSEVGVYARKADRVTVRHPTARSWPSSRSSRRATRPAPASCVRSWRRPPT